MVYIYGGINYTGFTVINSSIRADLHTAPKDKPLELYPYWMVTLPLDKYYPGFVTMIVVEIWAGTSEVIRVYPLGTGGGTTPEASPPPSATQPSSPAPTPEASQQPTVTASPTLSPEAFSSPTASPEPSVSQSPSQPPQPTDSSVQSAGEFPFAIAAAALAAAVTVTAAAFFLQKRRKTP